MTLAKTTLQQTNKTDLSPPTGVSYDVDNDAVMVDAEGEGDGGGGPVNNDTEMGDAPAHSSGLYGLPKCFALPSKTTTWSIKGHKLGENYKKKIGLQAYILRSALSESRPPPLAPRVAWGRRRRPMLLPRHSRRQWWRNDDAEEEIKELISTEKGEIESFQSEITTFKSRDLGPPPKDITELLIFYELKLLQENVRLLGDFEEKKNELLSYNLSELTSQIEFINNYRDLFRLPILDILDNREGFVSMPKFLDQLYDEHACTRVVFDSHDGITTGDVLHLVIYDTDTHWIGGNKNEGVIFTVTKEDLDNNNIEGIIAKNNTNFVVTGVEQNNDIIREKLPSYITGDYKYYILIFKEGDQKEYRDLAYKLKYHFLTPK